MKKFAIALALCCVTLTGFATEEEIVKATEVSTSAETASTAGDDTSPQQNDDADSEKDKGSN